MSRLLYRCVSLISFVILLLGTVDAVAPRFEKEFANYLINTDAGSKFKEDAQEKIFDPKMLSIDRNKGIRQNIIDLFYPQSYQDSGRIWELLKNAIIVLMVIFMFIAAADLLRHPDESMDNIKEVLKKFMYIIFGGLLCFIARWLLAQIGIRGGDNNIQGTAGLLQGLQGQYDGDEGVGLYNQTSGIFFDVLNTIKAAAFFIAILLIAWYGFQVIRAMDDESKLATAKQGLFNIVTALVVMRVIDFVYYIAQSPNFNSEAMNTLVIVSTYVGYLLGAAFILVLIYAGISVIISNGDESKLTKAKNYITTMFLIGITILLFLLIVYQVMQEIV